MRPSKNRILVLVLAAAVLIGLIPSTIQAADTRKILEKAAKSVRERNYEKAAKEYADAIKNDPKSADARLLSGLCQAKLGRYDLAVQQIKESIAIAPSYSAWRNLGLLYADKTDFKNAKDAYTRALELSPESAQGWYELGLVNASTGNFAEAVEHYNKAIKLNPRTGDAYLGAGAAYYWLGNRKMSLQQVNDLRLLGMNDKAAQLENWIYAKDKKKAGVSEAAGNTTNSSSPAAETATETPAPPSTPTAPAAA